MAFDQREQEIIRWGVENGKSRDEIQQAIVNLRAGIQPTKPTKSADTSDLGTTETVEEKDYAGKGIVDTFMRGGERMLGEVNKYLAPKQTAVEGLLAKPKLFGALATESLKLAGSVVAEPFRLAFEALPKETKEAIGSYTKDTITGAYLSLPEDAKKQVDASLKFLEDNPEYKEIAQDTADTILNYFALQSFMPGKARQTLLRHVADAKTTLKNIPPEDFTALGGLPKFLETQKQNIVLGLQSEGQEAVAKTVSAIDTSAMTSMKQFENAVLKNSLSPVGAVVGGVVRPVAEGVQEVGGKALSGVQKTVGSLFSRPATSVDDVVAQADNAIARTRATAEAEAPSLSVREKWVGISPDIKKRIAGKPEQLQEYFDVAHARNVDDTLPTPYEYGGQKAQDVAEQMKDLLNETGSVIGATRQKFATYKATPDQVARVEQGFLSQLAKLNLEVRSGVVRQKPGTIARASSGDIKALNDLYQDFRILKQSPTLTNIIDLRMGMDSRINFAKSAREVSNEVDPLARQVRKDLADVGAVLVGKTEAEELARYSAFMEAYNDLTSFTDKRAGGEYLLRLVLSGRGGDARKIIQTIKEYTGVDLMDDATMMTIATDVIGNSRQQNLFRQEMTKAGLDVASLMRGQPSGAVGLLSNVMTKWLLDKEKIFMEASRSTAPVPKATGVVSPKTTLSSIADVQKRAVELTKKNGGVTISLKGDIPTRGYAFAPSKTTERVVPQEKFNSKSLGAFINDNKALLNQPNAHLGVWVDEGKVYMDVSIVVDDFNKAMLQSEKAEQLAIFNLENFETIYLKDYEKIGGTYTKRGEVPRATSEGGGGAVEGKGNPERRVTPADDLSPDERAIESRAIEKYEQNHEAMVDEYIAEFGKVANTDYARRLFRDVGYKGTNSRAVHEPASELSKEAWRRMLATNEGDEAVLLAGGSGAGKTTAVRNMGDLNSRVYDASAVFDSNLSKLSSAKQRIAEAEKAGKHPLIVFIYREPKDAWINGVVKRMKDNVEEGGRTVPLSEFLKNTEGSVNTMKKLIDEGYDYILVDNSFGRGDARFMELAKLQSLKYNMKDLEQTLRQATKELYDTGKITKEQYESLLN